ncbi:MAG: hypothetical protein ACFCVE_06500 [Phycisphaerae bacterium]
MQEQLSDGEATHPPAPAQDGASNSMNKSFRDWMQEGQRLYDAAVAEYRQLEEQLHDIQQRLAAKKEEVNHIAGVIGQSEVEQVDHHRGTSEVIEGGHARTVSNSTNTIARALSGKGLGR